MIGAVEDSFKLWYLVDLAMSKMGHAAFKVPLQKRLNLHSKTSGVQINHTIIISTFVREGGVAFRGGRCGCLLRTNHQIPYRTSTSYPSKLISWLAKGSTDGGITF